MFRPVASDVSVFSDIVANGHQAMQHVSSSPSKIPYVGFSPVRLQTGIRPRPSPTAAGLSARPTYTRIQPTYTWPELLSRREHPKSRRLGQCSSGSPPQQRATSSPEALGSPEGYVVPPGHRLLWPHPSLSTPPVDLWLIRWVFALRPRMGWYREVPQFTLHVSFLRAVFRTPADRVAAYGCSFADRTSLRQLCRGSASAFPRTSVLAWNV